MDTPDASELGYAYLGELSVHRNGRGLALGGHIQRMLLALLLTERGRVVSVDRIELELWGDTPPDDPAASIQTYVSRLRRMLEPDRSARTAASVLARVGPGYKLDVPAGSVDAERFAGLCAQARRDLADGELESAYRLTGSALSLWRGEPLLEFNERPFAQPVRARLVEQWLGCEEDRAAALIGLGRPDEAVLQLEPITQQEPLRERPWLLLMTALDAAGRPGDALARYQRLRDLLDEELGLAPGSALRELHLRILRQEPPAEPVRLSLSSGHEEHTRIPRPERAEASAPPAPSLVGRDRERAQAENALDGLSRSGPHYVLVEGEAGIGKTRLVAEVTSAAAAAGAAVVWGRCHEDGDAPALWPWRQALSTLDQSARLPDGDGFAVFEYVMSRLTELSSDRDVVVVLDDLHWADAASLRLLAFLATELGPTRLAVVATCRDDESGTTLQRALSTLSRAPGFVRLSLSHLDRAGTAALVRGVLPSAEVNDDVVERIHARTGGNPFYATEVARLLGDRPDVAAATQALPASVRDVVGRRLQRLPDSANRALRLAAVVGERFDLGMLMRASSLDEDATLDGLDAALAAGLVRATGGGFGFAHALVRDTLLDGMTEVQRRRSHAAIAAAVGPGGDPTVRAHHLHRGRPFTDTADTLGAVQAAGDAAVRQLSYEESASWYQRALDLIDVEPGLDTDLRQRLQVRLGQVYGLAGRSKLAEQHLLAAIDTALERGDPATAAEAAAVLNGIAGTWAWVPYGSYPAELIQRLESVLKLPNVDSAARARLLAALAISGYYGPDQERIDHATRESMELASGLADSRVLIEAISARLLAIWREDRIPDQLQLIDRLLELAAGPGTEAVAVVAYMRRAIAHATIADLDAAARDERMAAEIASRARLGLYQAQLAWLRAAHATAAGRFVQADGAIDEGSSLLSRLQTDRHQDIGVVLRAFVRMAQGRLAEYVASLPEPDRAVLLDPLLVARASLESGDREGAAAVMAHAFGEPMHWWDWLGRCCMQAGLAADLGQNAVATDLVGRLRPHAGLLAIYGTLANFGPVALHLGRLEALIGDLDEAERHLRQALALSTRHRLQPSVALASHHLGSLLVRLGRSDEAQDHLNRARSLAEEMAIPLPTQR